MWLVCRSRAVRQALEGQSVFVNNILFFVSLSFRQITDSVSNTSSLLGRGAAGAGLLLLAIQIWQVIL